MEKIVYTYSHDTSNDTQIELVKCPGRTQIEIDFDMEDPNVGKEIAIYTSNEDDDFIDLAQEWLNEINAFLDGDKTNADVYEDYTSNMWYAMVNSLDWLINDKLTVRSLDGHEMRFVTVDKLADLVIDSIRNNERVYYDIATEDTTGCSLQDIVDGTVDVTWYAVKWIPLDMFDGNSWDWLVLIGHYGGGDAEAVYINSNEPNDYYRGRLIRSLMYELGVRNDDKFAIEIVKQKEEN